MRQSIHARPSERSGEPEEAGFHPTPLNLSAPLWAKRRHTSSCSSVRTFTQNAPDPSIRGQLFDVRDGANATSGGSSETLKNDWQVRPTGSSPSIPVTITIPDAKWP